MRLLELVRCSRPAAADDEIPASKSSATAAKLRRPNLRGRATTPWQPSLGPISEDEMKLLSPEKFPPAKSGKLSEKGKAQRTAAARRREERGDFRHYDVATVVPSLAPALFMF